MTKTSFTCYYVQAQKEGEAPEIVYHTYNEKENEYYYKFFDRKKAKELLEDEKKPTPEIKFRVVKCTQTYDAGLWI